MTINEILSKDEREAQAVVTMDNADFEAFAIAKAKEQKVDIVYMLTRYQGWGGRHDYITAIIGDDKITCHLAPLISNDSARANGKEILIREKEQIKIFYLFGYSELICLPQQTKEKLAAEALNISGNGRSEIQCGLMPIRIERVRVL